MLAVPSSSSCVLAPPSPLSRSSRLSSAHPTDSRARSLITRGLPARHTPPLARMSSNHPIPTRSATPLSAANDGEAVTASDTSQFYPHGITSISPESLSMAATVSQILDYRIQPMTDTSKYVEPFSALFRLKGKNRRWDIIKSLPSVGIVLYHTERDAFLLVRQFRPAVYSAQVTAAEAAADPPPPLSAGFTYEVCAGLIDKEKTMLDICHEEIMEECGYNVPVDSIVPVTSYIGSAGNSGAVHNLFAAKVDESMRESGGGGLHSDGEAIEVLSLPRSNGVDFLADLSIPKSAGLVAGLSWAMWNIETGKW